MLARRGEEVLRGLAVVRPPRPPRALGCHRARRRPGVVVDFDEQIDAGVATLELASGGAVAGWEVGQRRSQPDRAAGRTAASRRSAGGLAACATGRSAPTRWPPTVLEVEPPAWPASRDGLVFSGRPPTRPTWCRPPSWEPTAPTPWRLAVRRGSTPASPWSSTAARSRSTPARRGRWSPVPASDQPAVAGGDHHPRRRRRADRHLGRREGPQSVARAARRAADVRSARRRPGPVGLSCGGARRPADRQAGSLWC